MTGFAVDKWIVCGAAFAQLGDGAARLLLRASIECTALRIATLTPDTLRLLGGTPTQAAELVIAGFWYRAGDGWEGRTEPARVRAGRLNGQRSARARAERNGTAQPRSNPEVKPIVPRSNPEVRGSPPRSKPEPKPEVIANSLRSNPEVRPEVTAEPTPNESAKHGKNPDDSAVLGEDLRSPSPGPSPSFHISSDSDSFLDLERLQTEKARARASKKLAKIKEKPLTWRRVPDSWKPSDEHAAIASALNVDLKLEEAKFRDHEFRTPRRDADATFRNWIRGAKPSPRPLGLQSTNGQRRFATLEDIKRMTGN